MCIRDRFWHWALSFVVDPDSGLAWVGSVLLLVVTVRLLLMRSMYRQQFSMRKMAQIAPKMKELQNKYKDRKSPEDRQEQAKEMQALYADAGFVSPATAAPPVLLHDPGAQAAYLGAAAAPIVAAPFDRVALLAAVGARCA